MSPTKKDGSEVVGCGFSRYGFCFQLFKSEPSARFFLFKLKKLVRQAEKTVLSAIFYRSGFVVYRT